MIKKRFYFLKDGVETSLVAGRLKGETAKFDIVDKEGNVLVAAGKRITAKNIRDIENPVWKGCALIQRV